MGEQIIAGRYSVDAEVGRGGMGAVWRGTDTVLGRTVALKRIGIAPGGATADAVRAEREARLAARLNDPHVVAVYDLTVDGGQQWLVMEYVDGTDLAELIRRRGALSPDEVAPILAQTASALAAAHAQGIVHRDVKPSNILVTADGQVKLSDFGIARTQADAALTQTGLVTGSPAYLSPEVASGRVATPASDVWSLGATLYHALEGRPPYDLGENLIGGLYRIVHEQPPRPSDPGWLAPMPPSTMIHDPSRRWTAADVQAFLDGGPGAAAPPRTAATLRAVPTRPEAAQGTRVLAPSTPVQPVALPLDDGRAGTGRPRRWLLALAAVLLVAVVVGALALAVHRRDDRAGSTDSPTSTTSSGSTSPSADASPTAQGMTSFLENYLRLATSDPTRAFAMLTPAYQQSSDGESGYLSFWGDIKSAKLMGSDADPATLVIDYTYRYVKDSGGSQTERHRMTLTYSDGRYLIAGQD